MPAFELDGAWQLHPQVSVRPERFGALLYHFGTRRLSFVKSPELALLVSGLGRARSARECCAAAGIPEPVPDDVMAALATLAGTGMIVRRDPA
jgi:putative mycofactocin binding protein MftB